MTVDVAEAVADGRPIAAIAATTTWAAWPELWPALLDEVWKAVRATPGALPGRNVMLYLDDVPNVEAGVEVSAPFPGTGRVHASRLPEGRAVCAIHHGPYDELGAGHDAAIAECARLGLERLGPRWEIYSHETGDPADRAVEVWYLVA